MQGHLGRRGSRDRWAWSQGSDRTDKRHRASDTDELHSQQLGRIHQECLERDHYLRFGFDGGIAGDLEMTDHLHCTVAGLGLRIDITGQDRTRGGFSVDGVSLAVLAAQLPGLSEISCAGGL